MFKFSRLRKIASLLLVLCFILPLSQCSKVSEDGKESTVTYVSGINNITDGTPLSSGGDGIEHIFRIAVTVLTFFFPALILMASGIFRSVATVIVFVIVVYPLWFWVTLGAPQIGGILSLLSWFVLLITSIAELFKHRQKT